MGLAEILDNADAERQFGALITKPRIFFTLTSVVDLSLFLVDSGFGFFKFYEIGSGYNINNINNVIRPENVQTGACAGGGEGFFYPLPLRLSPPLPFDYPPPPPPNRPRM